MLKPATLLLFAVSISFEVSCQFSLQPEEQAAAPGWKEFSIGPATKWQSGFSKEGLKAQGIPLKKAIWRAYGIPEIRIVGGPNWLDTERYAITALVNDPEDFQPLFQQELAARFHLKAHREMREMPVYVLQTMDGAPHKLAPPSKDAGGRIEAGSVQLTNTRMAWFAGNLGDILHRPVIDETEIPGAFDINMKWKPGDETSLIEAVRDSLGLKLISEKRSMPVLVIDSVDKLTF